MQSTSAMTWLTTAELAERWRLTTRTLERWRVERYGPAWHNIGGSLRYSLGDVEAFEASSRSGGQAQARNRPVSPTLTVRGSKQPTLRPAATLECRNDHGTKDHLGGNIRAAMPGPFRRTRQLSWLPRSGLRTAGPRRHQRSGPRGPARVRQAVQRRVFTEIDDDKIHKAVVSHITGLHAFLKKEIDRAQKCARSR